MDITLTRKQWRALVPLVHQAARAERVLGIPVQIDNGDQKVEITADEITITLVDNG